VSGEKGPAAHEGREIVDPKSGDSIRKLRVGFRVRDWVGRISRWSRMVIIGEAWRLDQGQEECDKGGGWRGHHLWRASFIDCI
jgi:hypothetical protein